MGCKASTAAGAAPETRQTQLDSTMGINSSGLDGLLTALGLQWSDEGASRESSAVDDGTESAALVCSSAFSNGAGAFASRWLRGPTAPCCPGILFSDWDDTLFPISWFRMAEAAASKEPGGDALRRLSEEYDSLFAGISREVCKILTLAKGLSEVKICTNAVRPWVHSSNASFLKMPQSTLSDVEVAYAREFLMEKDRSKDPDVLPMVAKLRAMEHAIKEKASAGGSAWSNVVCIGDSPAEHTAIHFVMNRLFKKAGERYCLKNIKLIENPSLVEMLGQLRLLSLWLPKVIAVQESVYIDFDGSLETLLAFHRRFKPDATTSSTASFVLDPTLTASV